VTSDTAPAVHPLALWRTLRADQFDDAHIAALGEALACMELLREPRWADARRGDAAAAIAIAVPLMPINEVVPRVDVAMSALCLSALRGNPGAAVVFAHALRTIGDDDGRLKRCGASWLGHPFKKLLARTTLGLPENHPVRDLNRSPAPRSFRGSDAVIKDGGRS